MQPDLLIRMGEPELDELLGGSVRIGERNVAGIATIVQHESIDKEPEQIKVL